MGAWARRHDVVIGVYGPWLCALTVIEYGWPWRW
jgi:hypothetical protein